MKIQPTAVDDSSLPHAERIKKYLQRAYSIVRQWMLILKAKQKKRYDEGRRDLRFKESHLSCSDLQIC